jgi:hypothetical protein
VSSAVDRQEDEALRKLLEGLEADIRTLRTRQSVPRNLTAQAVVTSLPGDRDVSGFSIPANTHRYWTIKWTADGSQDAPVGLVSVEAYNGSVQMGRYGITDSSGTGYILVPSYVTTEKVNSIGGQIFIWTLDVGAGSSAVNLSFKASILGSSKGILEITQQ